MIATAVLIYVKEENLDEFIRASLENHRASVQEPGNLRFDILQNADDPTRFMFYEAYATAEDAAAHKNTPHYLSWRETVAPWMAQPREGIKHHVLAPTDRSMW